MNLLITGAWQDAQSHIDEIENMGHEVVFMQWEKDDLPCDGSWVEGVICNGLFIHHSLNTFPNLRFIQLTSAGYDRAPLKEIENKGIEIHNAKGVYSIPMAEFAVASVLERYKKLYEFRRQQERHEWKKIHDLQELAGRKVLIVGCGDVGSECAKRFKAFDCEVTGVNRTVRESEWFDKIVGLDHLDAELAKADIVIVVIALTENTKGIVKAKLINDDSILVNISRGETVDLRDTKCELILDVFIEEPLLENSSLWNVERVHITPHNSFVGDRNGERLANVVMQNIRRL